MAKQISVPSKKAPPGKAPPVKAPPVNAAPPVKAPPVNAAPPVKAPPVNAAAAAAAAVKRGATELLLVAMRDEIKALSGELSKAKERASFAPVPLFDVLNPPDPTFAGSIDPSTDWREPIADYCRGTKEAGPNPVLLRPSVFDEDREIYAPSGMEGVAPVRCYAGYPRSSDGGMLAVTGTGKQARRTQRPPEGDARRNQGMLAFYSAISEDGLYVTGAPYAYLSQAETEALMYYPGQPSAPSLLDQIKALSGVQFGTDNDYWAPIGLDGKPMGAWAPLPT